MSQARNVKDIAEQIEEERAKIDARTPITQDVFKAWRQKKIEVRRAKKAAEEEERKKKGIMTGREIFLQVRDDTHTHTYIYWLLASDGDVCQTLLPALHTETRASISACVEPRFQAVCYAACTICVVRLLYACARARPARAMVCACVAMYLCVCVCAYTGGFHC